MKDPAGPPVWLLLVVMAVWMFAVGVYWERHRGGGTYDMKGRLDHVRNELRRTRFELDERRRAAMPHLVRATPPADDVVVVEITGRHRRHAIRNGHAS